MRIHDLTGRTPGELIALTSRPSAGAPAYRTAAAAVCRSVQADGDVAVKRFTREFDNVAVESFRVSAEEIAASRSGLSPSLLDAIRTAITNITAFHRGQGFGTVSAEPTAGIRCWRESRPIRRVGLYVPSGTSPLPSTLMMLAIPALLAGCEEIVVCSPPSANGSVHPVILGTAAELGLREVYRIGGVQAIAAMAYGTASVPRVGKIFGPGNAYVTAAKQHVSVDQEGAAIDLVAGPSELLIIADASADPAFLAADLLSQAEHDVASQVVLVSTSRSTAERTLAFIRSRIVTAPRREIIERSLENSFAAIAESLDQAIAFSNMYAPEHLSLNIASPEQLVPRITNAGSVFIGPWSPVTAGDYASGTNHTLPTGGAAVSHSGVSVESFCKTISFQSLTREGLRSLSPTLLSLSRAEGLEEHARAVEGRIA